MAAENLSSELLTNAQKKIGKCRQYINIAEIFDHKTQNVFPHNLHIFF
jgi:hypothetical protein